ncbi:MAG TPA: hypothetical protein VE402_09775 [Candidatus Angelobacter sp.]|nr:hypothetical protein [Candidatus Angelobacter sp.]
MISTWIAALLTLCVFSFLYKDNPFYRFAEHLFVGASAGYLLAVQYQNVILPNVWMPLARQHDLVVLIPLALGIMMLARVWEKGAGIARWSIAFYVGIYSGVAIPGYMQAQIFAQLADAAKPWNPGWAAVNSALIFVGFLTVLAYFFFSIPHRGVQGVAARIGIYFLMVAFGASFGYTVMARVSLAIARAQFLLRDWLHILPG